MSTESTKTVKGRISNKHGTEEYWILSVYKSLDDLSESNKRDNPFMPLPGELIIYDPDSINDSCRFKIGDGVKNVVELDFVNLTFKDVDERPKNNILENVIYRYVETKENIYAVSGARKDLVVYTYTIPIIGLKVTKTYNINIEKLNVAPENLGSVSNKIGLISGDNITLYYNEYDNKVYGYLDDSSYNTIKTFEPDGVDISAIQKNTWYNPSQMLGSNYKDEAFNSVLDVGYGEAGVVREVEIVHHAEYFSNGQWYEIPVEAKKDYVQRIGDIAANKLDNTDVNSINIRAYKSVHRDYDRAYVEKAGNLGVSSDYCLTPSVEHLPEDPWTTPEEGVTHRIPSIPVRHADGVVEVYTDSTSSEHAAVSKKYLATTNEDFVRRKPDEAIDVYNSGVLAAHVWQPGEIVEETFANTFEDDSYVVNGSFPMAEEAWPKRDADGNVITDPNNNNKIVIDDDLIDKDIFVKNEESSENNLTIAMEDGNKFLHCNHPTRWKGESRYQIIRKGTENAFAVLARIRINPLASIEATTRGFQFAACSTKSTNANIWSGSNLVIANTDNVFTLAVGSEVICEVPVNEWFDVRLEVDGLVRGVSPVRCFVNNELKFNKTLTYTDKEPKGSKISLPRSYQLYIPNSGDVQGYQGTIDVDNLYVGDIPSAVRHNGYDSLTPVVYEYENAAIESLDKPTIPLREKDGSILTKKELSDADDDRAATSKYYVNNLLNNYLEKYTSDFSSVLAWNPALGYTAIAENYDNYTNVPSTGSMGSSIVGIRTIASPNTVTIVHDNTRHSNCVKIAQNTIAESRIQFKCTRTDAAAADENIVFSTDIKFENLPQGATRGVVFNGAGSINTNGAIYPGKIQILYDEETQKYYLTSLAGGKYYITEGEWFNLKVYYNGLTKDSPMQVLVNGDIVGDPEYKLGGNFVIAGNELFIGKTSSSEGTGFTGDIYIDNTYFGPINEDIEKEQSKYKITQASYRYTDTTDEHLVMRKADGSILVKKELTDADDDRIAASKYYVDEKVKSSGGSLPTDGMVNGAFLRYDAEKQMPVWDDIQYAEGNRF